MTRYKGTPLVDYCTKYQRNARRACAVQFGRLPPTRPPLSKLVMLTNTTRVTRARAAQWQLVSDTIAFKVSPCERISEGAHDGEMYRPQVTTGPSPRHVYTGKGGTLRAGSRSGSRDGGTFPSGSRPGSRDGGSRPGSRCASEGPGRGTPEGTPAGRRRSLSSASVVRRRRGGASEAPRGGPSRRDSTGARRESSQDSTQTLPTPRKTTVKDLEQELAVSGSGEGGAGDKTGFVRLARFSERCGGSVR